METQLNSLEDIRNTDLLNGTVFHVIVWEVRPFARYGGQFARVGNRKEVSDSGVYRLM